MRVTAEAIDVRKKVLVISSKKPFPVQDGAAIRTMQMVRMLSRMYEVDLAYTCYSRSKSEIPDEIRSLCGEIHEFAEPQWKCVMRALAGFFSVWPLQCCYFHSPRLARFVETHADRYDYVFCNNIRTAPYAESLACGKIIDYVDAISMNYEGAASKAGWVWRLIYRLESERLIRYECKVLELFDKHFIISDVDRRFILAHAGSSGSAGKIEVIGNSVECDAELIVPNDSRNIVFVGSMYYDPNIVAVTTFVRHVLPIILRFEPRTKFYIVGSRPVAAVRNLASEHVVVTGFVDDPKAYLRMASVVVVPMYSGAGVQNKILEAMSIGCCVVTTRIGAEGLDGIADGEEIFIRTDFQELADMVVALMRNRPKREEVGKKAKMYIAENLAFDHVFERFKRSF